MSIFQPSHQLFYCFTSAPPCGNAKLRGVSPTITSLITDSAKQYIKQFTTKCHDSNIIKCYRNPLRLDRYYQRPIFYTSYYTTSLDQLKECLSADCACKVKSPIRARGSRWIAHKLGAMKRILSNFGVHVY